LVGRSREAVIDYECLRGRQKRRSSRNFAWPAPPPPRRSLSSPLQDGGTGAKENGIYWIDGHIEYRELLTIFNEAAAGFAHLYAYGVLNCMFPAGLTGRSIHNLEEVNCPTPESFNHEHLCTLPQVSQILLRKRQRTFSLQLVDLLSADERFRLMPSRHDTSYCRFGCSRINLPRTSTTQSLHSCYDI